MGISRDEAREIAVVAIMLTIGLRLTAGIFQVFDELSRAWTWRSALGRFLAPVGSTLGMLSLALGLLFALSPTGSISMRSTRLAALLTGCVAVLGAVSVVNGLAGAGTVYGRIWFSLINGAAAAVLGGASWWILRNLDPAR